MMLMAAERGKWAQQRAGEPVAGRGLMSGCHAAKRSDWTKREARRVCGTCSATLAAKKRVNSAFNFRNKYLYLKSIANQQTTL